MRSRKLWVCLLCVVAVGTLGACNVNTGVPGDPAVAELNVTGTVFTIVMENHGAGAVLNADNPFISDLASRYGSAAAYLANVHPSLPNYLIMTSGSTFGIGDDGGPSAHPLGGNDNLADQLEAGGVSWRAYMEGMGEPCRLEDTGEYAVRHNPFVYYTSLSEDTERCREHVVDLDAHLDEDLANNFYQYMWITPDLCNDMHDCPTTTGDAWLADLIPRIMASPGYQEGGVIFLLWDEGSTDASYAASYVFHVPQNIPMIVISESIVEPGFVSNTRYTHDSYLATVEDTFGLPRLPTTVDSTPMRDFFAPMGTPF